MRGTPPEQSDIRPEQGIIPADAGNTSTTAILSIPGRDHPRGCGEHLSKGRKVYPAIGSSPRMRGTREITPATRTIGDHPRGCGEHVLEQQQEGGTGGSSPRMRGTQWGQGVSDLEPGIIPADAGNTQRCTRAQRPCGDHPRGCGEHYACFNISDKCSGSSPRMRGTRRQ